MIAARQAGILSTGGGHPMAAGFSLPADRIDAFRAFLNERLAAAAGLPGAVDLVVEGALAGVGGDTGPRPARGAAGAVRRRQRGAGAGAAARAGDRVGSGGREATSIRVFLEGEGGGPRLKAMLFRAQGRGAERGAAEPGSGRPASGRASAGGGVERGGEPGVHYLRRGVGVSGLSLGLTGAGGSATHRRPDEGAWSRSSRGPGHRPFTAVTRVRIPYGTPIFSMS